MIEQRVTLRYDAQQIPAIVQAVQGDTGRDVIFELADYEIPAGATANYYIDKPDGNAVYNSAEVISSTEILAHLTEQALAVPGRNNGQVRILADDEVITSFDFVLEVEAFRGLMRMQSSTEVNIFDQAIEEAVNTATEEAVAEIQAQTPVVTGMQNSIAQTYSASSTYFAGDYVMYNAQLYRCKADIETAEAWTAEHWTQIPLAEDENILKRTVEYDRGSSLPRDNFIDTGDNHTAAFTTANAALKPSGYSYTRSGWTVYKYALEPIRGGSVLHIKADGFFQFQTGIGLPSSGTLTVVGGTHPADDVYVMWPAGVTYLMIASSYVPYVRSCSLNTDQFISNVENTLTKQREAFTDGFYSVERRVSAAFTTDNARLKEDGYSCYDVNYKIYKYASGVSDRAKIYRIQANGFFQFQTSLSVPTTGALTVIGGTYKAGDVYIEWPEEAVYLMISSTMEPIVTDCGDVKCVADTGSVENTELIASYGIDAIINNHYTEQPISASFTTNNAFLKPDGYSVTRSGWTVYKYTLLSNARNIVAHIVDGYQIQFQTGIGLAPESAGTIIVMPIRKDDIYINWPIDATYLMVCAQTEPTVSLCFEQDESLIPESFTPAVETNQGENIGDNIRVMSYNVAHYNYDTAFYISNDKLRYLRQMLAKEKADIICTQEDARYIDGENGSKESASYIFNPVYPALQSGGSQAMIHSKKNPTSEDHFALCYSTRRWLDYSLFSYGTKTLLVISTHLYPGSDASAISNRDTEITELFMWLSGEIDLLEYKASEDAQWIHVPDHSHCIICMDGNTSTDTDKTNIETAANDAGFILSNGGRFGWFKTAYNAGTGEKASIDNIIVSDNIIINDVDVPWTWFWKLYSDHAPVIADLTLQ